MTFWQEHRSKFFVVLLILGAFAGGAATGGFGPAKVVEKEKVVEKVVEKIVYQDKIVEKIVKVKVKAEHEITESTHTKLPDGTETTVVKTETKTDTKTDTDSSCVEEKVVYVDKIVEKIVEKENIVLNQPDWSVYAGAGVGIPKFLGQGEIGVPGLQGAVIHAGVDRRILGPFWVGIQATSQGTLSLNLRGSF